MHTGGFTRRSTQRTANVCVLWQINRSWLFQSWAVVVDSSCDTLTLLFPQLHTRIYKGGMLFVTPSTCRYFHTTSRLC